MRRTRWRQTRRPGARGSDEEDAQVASGRRWARGVEVAAAAVVVAGALFAGGRFLFDSGADLLETDSSQVEVRQVVIVNGRGKSRLMGGRLVEARSHTPQLDITVRNTGKLPALLTGVRISIVDSDRLNVCEFHTGDMVPVTGKYAITLPILPTPAERTFVHPLHQEVPAGGVDRFKVYFRLPWNGEHRYLYALDVALVAEDASKPLEVGRFVLGVPETVAPGVRRLPEGPDPYGILDDHERLLSTWCAKRNMDALERILGREGRRSPSMAAMAAFEPAGWWADFADPRPARAVVEPLLRPSLAGWDPALAVYAAEQTGDRELEAKTRHRVAEILLSQGEDALENLEYGYMAQSAVEAIRESLLFEPSALGKALLARAEQEAALYDEELAEMPATVGE